MVLGVMHKRDVLRLDEPTNGLDPLNQQEFYELLREARDGGASVFLSSHVLSEVEHVCDTVGILRVGKLVRVARLDDLRAAGETSLEEVSLSYYSVTVPEQKALPE